jgi:hypothetical protein
MVKILLGYNLAEFHSFLLHYVVGRPLAITGTIAVGLFVFKAAVELHNCQHF